MRRGRVMPATKIRENRKKTGLENEGTFMLAALATQGDIPGEMSTKQLV